MHDVATVAAAELGVDTVFEPVPIDQPVPARRTTGRRGAVLHLVGVVVAIAFAAPVLYVAWRALTLGGDRRDVLAESIAPAWRTVQLGVFVTTAAGLIGVALAWLLTRTDLPFAGLWRVLAPIPLVFPSFIGAAAFIAGLGPDGILREVLELVGYHPPRRFRGLGASVLVLTLFTYPLVYLPVAARLATLPPQLEESSRLLGDRPAQTFGRVTLPLVRGAIAGGTLMILLYCLSEFGAVQLLGFDTLTRVVYATRLADRAASFMAAAILVVMALAAILIERRLRGPLDQRTGAAARRSRAVLLGRWKVPATAFVVIVLGLALVVPVVSLAQWAWRAVANADEPRPDAFRHELGSLDSPAWTTAWLGVVASVIAIAVVVPVAVLAVRHRTRISAAVTTSITAGFAVPGLVIALSLTFWALRAPGLSTLYQTVPLLIVAYVVHFGAQALRSSELAVGSVPRALDESAVLLGASPVRRALTVHLPLMLPGLLAGCGLVMLSVLKELPATLLLAPIGYETLTTRVWGAFEDGFLAEVGFAALALLAASTLLTWLIILRRSHHLA
jgi:iron(III) transport system permease protein